MFGETDRASEARIAIQHVIEQLLVYVIARAIQGWSAERFREKISG